MSRQHSGWDWSKVADSFWQVPSEDVYFLLNRWKELRLSRVLDLGCGIGRHALLLAEHGFRVAAVDISQSGLEALAASAKASGLSVDVVLADARELPFPDASFDAVLAYHSIYHVDAPGMRMVFSEVRRVLKPGGEVYLTMLSKSTPSFSSAESAVVDDNVRMKREEEGSLLPHYYVDQSDIGSLLEGFQIMRLRQIEDIYGEASSWHYFIHASLA